MINQSQKNCKKCTNVTTRGRKSRVGKRRGKKRVETNVEVNSNDPVHRSNDLVLQKKIRQ